MTGRDRRARRDSENGQSACPVCVWQTGQTVPSVCDRRDSQTAAETWQGRQDAKEKKQECIDVNDVKAKQTMIRNAVRYVSFQVPGRRMNEWMNDVFINVW